MDTSFGPYNQGVQAGQIFGSTFHFHGVKHSKPGTACLASLHVPQMGTRNNLSAGAPGTGQWLLSNKQYLSWRKKGGVLWIAGGPGCGKSVLMDTTANHERQQCSSSPTSIISFFFHHADGGLHVSRSGLYQSILYQVLEQDPQALSDFVRESDFNKRREIHGRTDWTGFWQERELRERCKSVFQTLISKNKQALLYVDAMEECANKDARGLLREFRDISIASQGRINFCVSSRPDLLVGACYNFMISMKDHNEADVRIFLDERLQYSTSPPAVLATIKSNLILRTEGVFLWLCRSIDKVEALLSHSSDTHFVLKKIGELPQDLRELYRDIVKRMDSDLDDALRVFQWITLAITPLPLDDLDRALSLGDPRSTVPWPTRTWCADLKQLEPRLNHITRGLVKKTLVPPLEFLGSNPSVSTKVTGSMAHSLDVSAIAQWRWALVLDHESVYEFMETEGLHMLASRCTNLTTRNPVAEMHASMAKDCLKYILSENVLRAVCNMHYASYKGEAWQPDIEGATLNLYSKAPALALYAGLYWQMHATAAEQGGASAETMASLFSLLGVLGWPKKQRTLLRMQFGPCDLVLKHGSQFYTLLTMGLHQALEGIAKPGKKFDLRFFVDTASKVRYHFSRHNTNHSHFWSAWKDGSLEMLKLFIDGPGMDERFPFLDVNGVSLLHRISLPLDERPTSEFEKTRMLVNSERVDVRLRDLSRETPFGFAVSKSNVDNVNILQDCADVDVNERTHNGSTPLMFAVYNCGIDMVETLLRSERVKVNTRTHNQTPLHAACFRGSLPMVKIFIADKRVDQGAIDDSGFTPLAGAMMRGHPDVVKCLIAAGTPSVVEALGGADVVTFGVLYVWQSLSKEDSEDRQHALQAFRENSIRRGEDVKTDEAKLIELVKDFKIDEEEQEDDAF